MVSRDSSKQINKNKNIFQSLGHAISGILRLVKEERNFKFDLFIIIFTVILGILLKVRINQWLWLFVAFFAVIEAEVVNSIIENIVDLIVGPKFNDLAKRAKDIAAGGVLISAIFAFFVGILIFVPEIIKLFN